MAKKYDLIVVGGGTSGLEAAKTAAENGLKVALLERKTHPAKIYRSCAQMFLMNMDSFYNERMYFSREKKKWVFPVNNFSVNYNGVKINIIDTPGHADFGGEVERVLNMADGVLLLVDAFEGPMPQTRFVLSKAIQMGLKPIVVVNKVDKPNCKPDEAQDSVFDLMFNLDATEEQLDFHTVYGSAKNGWMSGDWNEPTTDVKYL